MRKILLFALVVIAILVLISWRKPSPITNRGNSSSFDQDTDLNLTGCLVVNRTKFPKRWNQSSVDPRELMKIADKLLGGKQPDNLAAVAGFFKSIDTLPEWKTAQYYSKDLVKWARQQSYPLTDVLQGQSICLN